MADSKYSNLARKQEFHENDPFAELTRIIGFEPHGARPLPAGEDANLGIDLEKELMGEFDDPDKLDGISLDTSAFVWDADQLEPEQDGLAAGNGNADGDDAQDHRVTEDLLQAEEPWTAEADDQDLAFDAALDAELSREAESWVFEEEQAETVFAKEPTEQILEELSLEEPAELVVDEPAELVMDEPVEMAVAELAAPESRDYYPDPVEEVASFSIDAEAVEDLQEETPAESVDIDFVDMDFGVFEEAGRLDESAAVEAAEAVDLPAPEPVVSTEPAPVVEANIEDELAVLLGSFRPAEAQAAGEHDPADYDFGDILADGPVAVPAAAAVEDVVEAAQDWQPEEDAAWDLDEVFAEETQPAAEPAEATLWQDGYGVAAPAPAAESDILDDLAAEVAASEPVAAVPAARDPFAALAAMAAAPMPQFSRVNLLPTGPYAAEPRHEQAYARPAAPAEPVADAGADEDDLLAEIDSIEIPETAIAVADDLDLPEVEYQEAVAAAEFDELDHDLHGLFAEQQPPEPIAQPAQPATYPGPDAYSEDELRAAVERAFEEEPIAVRPYEPAAAAVVSPSSAGIPQAAAAPRPEEHAADPEPDFSFDEAFGYDPELQERAEPAQPALLANRRNLLMAAAAVVGVIVVGGAGTFFLGGGSESSSPVLVQADGGPFKVRPENPGGTTVPNQNREVYERVTSGPTEAAPAQERLVSTVEEPIDVATRIPALSATPAPEAASEPPQAAPAAVEPVAAETAAAPDAGSPPPMVEDFTIPMKSEERLAPTPTAEEEAEASEVALVTPRKVQTFVVRPDGTMVPNEPPVQQASLPAQEDGSAAETIFEAQPIEPAAATPAAEAPASAEGAAQPEMMQAALPADAGAEANDQATAAVLTPASVPIAPPRPADQPVDIVGEVRRDQVAAVEPQSQAAPAGGWSMQIASQPSAESAQATYASLASRYGEVIGGRGVNIVKAEVTGKGTYYRVRVPAGTRADAISLCEQYKSAGGSCFVSQ